ncbi:MAG: ABC transporter substrate-binding protein [Betaproteobacteria bacterium]|nr:ABC transporter substrate-binding protein [Betaproteobacteria bacterium]
MKNWLKLIVMAAGFCAAGARAEIGPLELARATTEDVLAIIKKDKDIQGGNQQKTLELVESKILPHFDFGRMTRLAVGKHWRQASPQQQQALIGEFKTLLVRTYSSAFTQYRDQTVEFKPLKMNPADTEVTVRSQIRESGRPPIPIDYAVEKTANGWKVFDVTVEGVSLVTTYRGTFGEEVQRGGIDGLIKTLVEKNKTPASPAAKK